MIKARLGKCLCGGDLIPVVLDVHDITLRNGETIVFEKVPVEKCLACGDMFYSDIVVGMFEEEIKKGFRITSESHLTTKKKTRSLQN